MKNGTQNDFIDDFLELIKEYQENVTKAQDDLLYVGTDCKIKGLCSVSAATMRFDDIIAKARSEQYVRSILDDIADKSDLPRWFTRRRFGDCLLSYVPETDRTEVNFVRAHFRLIRNLGAVKETVEPAKFAKGVVLLGSVVNDNTAIGFRSYDAKVSDDPRFGEPL